MLVVQHKTIINFMVLGLICLLVFNLYDGLPSRDHLTLGFNKYHYFVEKPEPEKIVGKTINQEGIPLKSSSLNHQNTNIPLPDIKNVVYFYNSTISSQEKYAVFGANIPSKTAPQSKYIYNLPLASRAWNRIGFGSIVIISGNKQELDNEPILQVILNELISQSKSNKFSLIIMMIECNEFQSVGIAQIGRLFVTNFLLHASNNIRELLKNTYFITADVDLFPTRPGLYTLAKNREILVTNKLKGDYNDIFSLWVALSCVGASFEVWQKMINFDDCPAEDDQKNIQKMKNKGNSVLRSGCYINYRFPTNRIPKNASEIFNYIKDYSLNPDVYRHGIIKGDRRTWYTDQDLLSLRIRQYVMRHGLEVLDLQSSHRGNSHKNTNIDTKYPARIGRNSPQWWHQVDRFAISLNRDCHLLQESYTIAEWWKLHYLLKQMFSDQEIELIQNYRMKFIETWLNLCEKSPKYKKESKFRSFMAINQEINTVRFWQKRHKNEDLHRNWTEIFPRKYYNSINKKELHYAKWNPKTERAFAEFENYNSTKNPDMTEADLNDLRHQQIKIIYVVPKLSRPYDTKPGASKNSSIPIFCNQACFQISYSFLKKRR